MAGEKKNGKRRAPEKRRPLVNGPRVGRGGAADRIFWDIPSAAGAVGVSIRHFRRIMERDHIPTIKIGRRFFILGQDLQRWQSRNAT